MAANISKSGAASESDVQFAHTLADALQKGDYQTVAQHLGNVSVTTKGDGAATVSAAQAAQYASQYKPKVEIVYAKIAGDHLTAKVKYKTPAEGVPNAKAGSTGEGTALITATIKDGKISDVEYEQDTETLHKGLGLW